MLADIGGSHIRQTRWSEAQEYEQAFWQRRATSIEDGTSGQLDWYDWKARQLEEHLGSVPIPRSKASRVLEIGSGPIGIINSLEWGERYAIDPLEQFYRQRPSLIRLRKPGATYLPGTGERLPLRSASFSLVIIDNVIDHTYAPAEIIREIARILDTSGSLYLTVNVHTWWGAVLHKLLAVLRIDKGHPYTFTSGTLRRFVARHGFKILREETEDYRHVRRTNRRSASLRERIKGYTGLSEFQHTVLCRKNTPTINT